jgi:chromosome segregation ATPase
MSDDILDEEDDEELVQVSHLVPRSVREDAQANSGHGDLSDAVRMAYRTVAYGDDYQNTARLKQRLERAKNEYRRLTEEKDGIEAEMDEAESRIRTLREQIADAEDADERFEAKIQELETKLHSGTHIFPNHGGVIEAAEAGGMAESEVIDALRERNPDIPEDAFVPVSEAEFEWTGTDDAV